VWLLWLSLLALVPEVVLAQGRTGPLQLQLRGHLTGPSVRDPLEIGTSYLRQHGPALGLSHDDLEDLHVVDRYVTSRTGTTHLYLRQRVGGIEVHGADVTLAVDSRGRLLPLRERLIREVGPRAVRARARLDAEDAILSAALHLGITPDRLPRELRATSGPARAAVYEPAAISADEIPVELVYVIDDAGVARLCWSLVIRPPAGGEWWNLFVDAEHGEVLREESWIAHDTYAVHPLPQQSPDEGPRELLVDPADTLASPFGWHDTNAAVGPEFTDTQGNNVVAQDDIDADDQGGSRPDGGPGLDFDPPLDLTKQPGNNLDASVANLFYVSNVVHDVLYHYGFDEQAGNFQQNNYGNGGVAGDPVRADTQDGSGSNNAQFGTPPDGLDPRMEMFRWTLSPSPRFVVTAPPAIAGTYFADGALFGGGTTGLGGSLVQAVDPADGAGPTTTDACSSLTNPGAVAGNIALIDRGICTFVTKVANAQAAGAVGVVVANNAGNGLVGMSGVDPSVTIPAIFVGQSDGATLAGQLVAGVSGNLVSLAERDSSLDAAIVVHEYVHGLSSRLTGGPSTVGCLDAGQSAGMGEGWSDWFALVMTAMASDVASDPRGIGAYLLGQSPSGGGIRNAPYSTDMLSSPLTYGDISFLNQPHGVGEVWASALWETYWNFVDVYGFDEDLFEGSGGNNRALEVVVDALKLQPCDPTFVDGRDALLAADLNLNAAANECLIWEGFAKRGIGFSASDGGSSGSLAVTEAFDIPPVCVPEPSTTLGLLSGGLLVGWLERRRRL
jgi:extracellular elastinolytic metalloproteinase